MKIGSLFSGIGGLELGLERAGLGETVWQCEIDPYCRKVLRKHWRHTRIYEDIVGQSFPGVDLICGGFPCQNLSAAGRKEGLAGEKSWLWREFFRVICEIMPEWVVVENVQHTWRRWVPYVRGDLARLGYWSAPLQVSAAETGAPHLRKRVFVVAASSAHGWHAANPEGIGCDPWSGQPPEMQSCGSAEEAGAFWAAEPGVCRVAYGVPNRLDRLRALGNAVVPQCAELIGREISYED